MRGQMSKNDPYKPNIGTGRLDRRIQRTYERLGRALVELAQQKPFETITVEEIVNRAKVARSTFYIHFSNKDDLFLSDVETLFALVGTLLTSKNERSHRVAPVAELFTHVASARRLYDALIAAGKRNDVRELGVGHLARSIKRRLKQVLSDNHMPAAELSAISEILASSLLSFLFWWLDRKMPLSSVQADELFHRLVWKGLSSYTDVR